MYGIPIKLLARYMAQNELKKNEEFCMFGAPFFFHSFLILVPLEGELFQTFFFNSTL